MTREMNCKELVEVVTEYLEGTLEPDDRARLERHKDGCPGCVNHIQQMRQTLTLLGHVLEDEVPKQSRDRLIDAFRRWKKPGD